MRGRAVSKKVSLLAGLVCCAAAVVGLGVTSASGAPAPAPKTLAQAMSERHGQAAGDPVYVGKGRKGVDRDAEGVNAGTRKQAAGVKLGRGRPVTSEHLLSKGDRSGACTIGYGRGLQCLPTTPPSAGQMGMSVAQMPWTCTEVRTLLPEGLPLNKRGEDPANLDSNSDGLACGDGDQ